MIFLCSNKVLTLSPWSYLLKDDSDWGLQFHSLIEGNKHKEKKYLYFSRTFDIVIRHLFFKSIFLQII
jgi:hypothetical protein